MDTQDDKREEEKLQEYCLNNLKEFENKKEEEGSTSPTHESIDKEDMTE